MRYHGVGRRKHPLTPNSRLYPNYLRQPDTRVLELPTALASSESSYRDTGLEWLDSKGAFLP